MNFNLVVTNLAGGGAERSMLRLAAALGRRGHRARLVLLEDRVEHDVPAGTEIRILAKRVSKGLVGKFLSASRLKKSLGHEKSTTISTLPFADEVAIRAKLPNLWCRISNNLSAEIGRLEGAKQARRRARYRKLYDGRNLIAVSDGVADDLRGPLELSRSRIVRIYNGFDFEAIRAAAAQPEPALPREPFVVHAGRFMPQKRHDLLLDAWLLAKLPHKLVLLAGASDDLKEMISRKGLDGRVLIAGFKQNPYPWMRAAECLVLSSDREGMPNVLVEALACGTRVVSTDCPSGPREVLQGELARGLVPCNDAPALAAALRAALERPRPGLDALPAQFAEAHMASAYEALGPA